jgi:glycosyltransferase involved in cell wall biosynthesis
VARRSATSATVPLRGLATWISRQSKNALDASAPELAAAGIRLRLSHFTVDYGRFQSHLPTSVVEYLAIVGRVLFGRLDFLLVNPADTWLRRPRALRGVLLAARIRRVPVVARWGNPDWIYRHKTTQRISPRAFSRITREIVDATTANLVLTAAQGREVMAWVGFTDMDVIGNCKRVPDQWLTTEREPPADGLIVNVASVQPLKGPDLFVRVAHEVVTTSHPRARFVWIGGLANAAVEALIDELGVAGSVEFRAPMHPPYPLLQQASGMLFPSRSEAFGLAIAEALACGLPVCCFEGIGPAEVVGDCGAVVEMESVAQAADAVRAFLDEDDHAAVTARSRARYRARYAPGAFADNLDRVLRDRLRPGRAPSEP